MPAPQGRAEEDPTAAVKVVGGATFTAALRGDGTVWTWGYNSMYQHGTGNMDPVRYMRQVTTVENDVQVPLSDIKDIAVGSSFTVALNGSHEVYTWGTMFTYEYPRPTKMNFPGDVDIQAVAAGASHAIALDVSGNVWAWGYGGEGQLGGSTGSATPVRVQTAADPVAYLSGVTQIASGERHGMALRTDDTVWTWGYNYNKSLGHSETETYVHVARPVPGLSGVVSIYSGPRSGASFATTANQVYAWGYNAFQTLGIGDGSAVNRIVPEPVPFFDNNLPESLLSTGSATLALMPNGDVFGVGFDPWEYTLSTISTSGVTTFTKLEELSGVQSLNVGWSNVFAVGTDGSVKGWGKNGYSDRLLGSYASTWEKYSYPVELDDAMAHDFSVKPVSNVEVEVDKNTFSVYYDESVFSDHTSVVMEAVYGDGEWIYDTNGRGWGSFYQDHLEPGNYNISLYTTDGENDSTAVSRTITIEEPTVFLDVTALNSEGEAVTEGTVFVLKNNGEGYDPIAQEELGEAGVARFEIYETGELRVKIISPGYHDQGKMITLAVGENAATLRLADASLPDPDSFDFTDGDERQGFISGELSWNFYPDETPTFDAFQLVYENEAGESLGKVTEDDLSVYQEAVYISEKALNGAVRVRLYTVKEDVPTKTAVSYPLWDFSPEAMVRNVHLVDTDPIRGKYSLRARFDGAEQPGIAEKYVVTERAFLSGMDPVLLAEAPVGQETMYDIPIVPRLEEEEFVLVFVGLMGEDGSIAPWEYPVWIPDNTSGTAILEPFSYDSEGQSPENVTFFDTDPDEGEIGGPIHWDSTSPFMDAEILFANDSGPIWGSPILHSTIGFPFGRSPEFGEASSESESEMEWPDYFHSLYIPENTEIPDEATRIAIFDRSPFSGGGPPAYVSIAGEVVTVVPAGSGDRFLRLGGAESVAIPFSEALSAASQTAVTDAVYGSAKGDTGNFSLFWEEDGATVTLNYIGADEVHFDEDVIVSVTGTSGAIGHHLTIIDVGALSENHIVSTAIGELVAMPLEMIKKIPLGTTVGELLAGLATMGHRAEVVAAGVIQEDGAEIADGMFVVVYAEDGMPRGYALRPILSGKAIAHVADGFGSLDDGASVVRNIPKLTTAGLFETKVYLVTGASGEVVAADGAPASDDTIVANGMKYIVTAEDGSTREYGLEVAVSTGADIEHIDEAYGSVEGSIVRGIPAGTTAGELLSAVTVTQDAYGTVYEATGIVAEASTPIADGMTLTVTAESGFQRVYGLRLQATTNNILGVTSTVYGIYNATTQAIENVPLLTTAGQLIDVLVTNGASVRVVDSVYADVYADAVVTDGMWVRVTAEDGSYADYPIRLVSELKSILSTLYGVVATDGIRFIPKDTDVHDWFVHVVVSPGATKTLLNRTTLTPANVLPGMKLTDDYVLRVSAANGTHWDYGVHTLSSAIAPNPGTPVTMQQIVQFLGNGFDITGDGVFTTKDVRLALGEISERAVFPTVYQ